MPYIIEILILLFLLAICLIFYKKLYNFFVGVRHYKKYVVVHRKNPQTDFVESWRVKPETQGLTKVGVGNDVTYHDLSERYALLKWKGRNHYVVDADDSIPKMIREREIEDLRISAEKVKASLQSKGYEAVFGNRTNIPLIVAMIALIVALATAVYSTMQVADNQAFIQFMFQKMSTPITNVSVVP